MGSVTNLKTNKTLFIPCNCQNEIMKIEFDHETKIAEFAIYHHNIKMSNKLSLWQKIRYIIQIIFYGYPYGDQIVLDEKQLKELRVFLSGLGY